MYVVSYKPFFSLCLDGKHFFLDMTIKKIKNKLFPQNNHFCVNI